MTQRLSLCSLREGAEKPAFPAEFLVLNDPQGSHPLPQTHGLFFFQINNINVACGALSVSPPTAPTSPPQKQLWMRWDAKVPEGAWQSSASLSSIPVSPGNHIPISHHTFTLTLHYMILGQITEKLECNLGLKKINIFKVQVKNQREGSVWADTQQCGRTQNTQTNTTTAQSLAMKSDAIVS